MTLTLTPTEAASLPCEVLREMEPQPPEGFGNPTERRDSWVWHRDENHNVIWCERTPVIAGHIIEYQLGGENGTCILDMLLYATVQSVEPVKVDQTWFWKIRVEKGE